MNEYKIEFQNLKWETTAIGAKQKQFYTHNKRIRLLRLEDSFKENDWCTNGHFGYVLEGNLTIQFSEEIIHFAKGDGITISGGLEHKHKAIVEKGNFVELLLIEDIIDLKNGLKIR